MEPPWEDALDVDDSDLQSGSLLRPCKQQRRRDETNHLITTANLSQSQTLASSQTVESPPRNLTPVHQAEAPPPLCTIPGPAGIVQAAKLRKTCDSRSSQGPEESPMATQEYIRRVVEDPMEDEDFKSSPWLSATEFVKGDGLCNSVPSALLGQINKWQKDGKLDQVVAVIKYCAPNELGDLTVTLKDPTGTVSGTVHHKILAEGEFKKGICVGSVLVLHKVSVFSPSRSARYLNIMKRNLVKVFYKDGGSSEKQTFHGCRITDAVSSSDSGLGTPISRIAFSLKRGAEGTANGIKINTFSNQSLNIGNQQQIISPNVSLGHQCSKTSNKDMYQKIAKDKEILKEADVSESSENVALKGSNRVQVRIEPAMAHDWTDEQVNLLLDLDMENDI